MQTVERKFIMDNIITAARELGKLIQQDERYLQYIEKGKTHDENMGLKEKMERFNEIRREINLEVQKSDRDADRIKELDTEMRSLYAEILDDDSVVEFNAAQQELQQLLTFVNQIIQGSANGENPDEIEFSAGCSASDCAGCSGC